jgi:hypothetical protein
LIDWDFAQPGAAITDLGYLAWYAVPLSPDRRAEEYGFVGGVDRAQRLRILCSAYGSYSPAEVIDETLSLIETERIQTMDLAERGLAPWTRFAADGDVEGFAAEVEWIRRNRQQLLAPASRAN